MNVRSAKVRSLEYRYRSRRHVYVKPCEYCGAPIFLAYCRDGLWRAFERPRVAVETWPRWYWSPQRGMVLGDRKGHVEHVPFCPTHPDHTAKPGGPMT